MSVSMGTSMKTSIDLRVLRHRLLLPITHRKFRKNIYFLADIWDLVVPAIVKFDICSLKMVTGYHLEIWVFFSF